MLSSKKAPMTARTPGSWKGCWCPMCHGGKKGLDTRYNRKRDRREGKKEIIKQLSERQLCRADKFAIASRDH